MVVTKPMVGTTKAGPPRKDNELALSTLITSTQYSRIHTECCSKALLVALAHLTSGRVCCCCH